MTTQEHAQNVTLSPTDYLYMCILEHPLLYAGYSLENARFAVLDQLFNTIGNGIDTSLEFLNEISKPRALTEDERKRALRYLNEPVFEGFTKLTTRGNIQYEDFNSSIGYFLEEEKTLHPKVLKWVDCKNPFNKQDRRDPYPNFTKDYSLVWYKGILKLMTPEWKEEAIWYYTVAKNFFMSNDSCRYSTAFPKNSATETKKYAQDCKDTIQRYHKNKTNEELSVLMEHPYTGDVHEFLSTKWIAEKNRITDFIDKTILRLKK